ncbi:hypothetical protein HMPREF0673_02486 [Leyella stercorea DSM 18206]|uniref:Uncharacterized protein n=1 Tax=Leyella stercorea DSM 18206 TaxID=1002367 RepID=G6B0R8_9BACT|nr:hypothetical protein HMPREF0673_02486 [Leyella stercorea DSM 18206]
MEGAFLSDIFYRIAPFSCLLLSQTVYFSRLKKYILKYTTKT